MVRRSSPSTSRASEPLLGNTSNVSDSLQASMRARLVEPVGVETTTASAIYADHRIMPSVVVKVLVSGVVAAGCSA
jgi:hypothetical protein